MHRHTARADPRHQGGEGRKWRYDTFNTGGVSLSSHNWQHVLTERSDAALITHLRKNYPKNENHMLLRSNGHDPKPQLSYSSQAHRKHSNKASLDVRFLSPSHVTWRHRGGSRLCKLRICQKNPEEAMHSEQPLTAGNQISCFLQSVRVLVEAHHCCRGRWRIGCGRR